MAAVQTIAPVSRDLGGGFTVRRLLPSAERQAVGPFVFFDHFGPVDAEPGVDHDVRPHPHIGLSTVTYLYEGAMQHHDSTGARQRIVPGAVNWMTAGRGVVHSERTPVDLREQARRIQGLQLWAALPEDREEDAPAFEHTPASAIPECAAATGVTARVLVGEAFGATSPVTAPSPTLLVDLRLAPGAVLTLAPAATPGASERALYAVEGSISIDGAAMASLQLVVLPSGAAAEVVAGDAGARLALIGGQPLGVRHLYWNFVSSRRERVRQAAEDWSAGRFPALPGEPDTISLPARRLAP
jgi:hypothetical protein